MNDWYSLIIINLSIRKSLISPIETITMKLKNISGRSQFMRTHKPQPDKNIRIDLENQLKAQAERDGTLKKYVKTNISLIENTPVISKTDTEDLSNTGLTFKTPYSNITTYREEWYTHPIDK